jgi:hypothetical protein
MWIRLSRAVSVCTGARKLLLVTRVHVASSSSNLVRDSYSISVKFGKYNFVLSRKRRVILAVHVKKGVY